MVNDVRLVTPQDEQTIIQNQYFLTPEYVWNTEFMIRKSIMDPGFHYAPKKGKM